MNKQFDVVIIGTGLTGYSALLHLHRQGIRNICMIGPSGQRLPSPALTWGGYIDNITRITVSYGRPAAARIWRAGNLAVDRFTGFLQHNGLPHVRGKRLRLISSDHELEEAQAAQKHFQSLNIPSHLRLPATEPEFPGLTGSRVLAVQDDGLFGCTYDAGKMWDFLETLSPRDMCQEAVSHVHPTHQGVEVRTSGGRTINTEFAVIAAHTGTAALLPALREVLIPVSDQWCQFELSGPGQSKILPGTCFTANHANEWGCFTDPTTLIFGGGRFLRPNAGIGQADAPTQPRVTTYLVETIRRMLSPGLSLTHTGTWGLTDIRPCDELPVIGPMFGESRILVGAGYMNLGASMAFFAGECLSALIARGQADELPAEFRPERLRTLRE